MMNASNPHTHTLAYTLTHDFWITDARYSRKDTSCSAATCTRFKCDLLIIKVYHLRKKASSSPRSASGGSPPLTTRCRHWPSSAQTSLCLAKTKLPPLEMSLEAIF